MTYLSWYDQAAFKSYEDIYKWFKTARSPARGKPFGRWARVYQDNDKCFRVVVHNTSFLQVTPENKAVVLLDAPGIRTINNTLSANLHRLLPMFIIRTGKLHYKIESLATIKAKVAQSNSSVWHAAQEGVEAFAGLTLDLTTGKFDNPKKDLKDRVNNDMRRQWLSTLRKFKRGIKVRFKLGVFDKYVAEVGSEYASINWSEPQHISMLHCTSYFLVYAAS